MEEKAAFRAQAKSAKDVQLMDESDFEGTLVLEKLAGIGKVEDFFDAIDSDDFDRAKTLLRRAGVEASDIAIVLKKMADTNGEN
jgi:hypothetical protein